MTKATIAQAKHRLRELVDAALRGEAVVITRRSKPAVAIVRVESAAAPLRVSDAAAAYLEKEAREELASGVAQVHKSPAAFAATLTRSRRRG